MKQQSISYPTFVTTLIALNSWQRRLLATSVATAILAIAANLSIPVYPVPFTLQSLAVLLIGAFLGRQLGTLAIVQYLCVGAMGLPVFAGGSGGIAALISPSAGYLFGYLVSAYIAGFAAEQGYDRRFLSGLIAFACAHQVMFVFGVAYLKLYFHSTLVEAINIGYVPFLGFDLLKFMLATMVMVTLWRYRARK